jgi:tellurite methyltransferase
VLHFARHDEHFTAMVKEMWRVLRGGGVLFCRLASTIGMADRMHRVAGRRFLLPDGTERYLVDEEQLMTLTERMGGTLVDPLKTTVVQDQRCMTTWVVRKY